MSWRDTIKIHPACDAFPPLGDDELAALGEDIKDKGRLIHPVAIQVNDGMPVFLDGRNRLDAMERIGWRVQIKQGEGKRGRPGGWYLLVEGDDNQSGEGYPAETVDHRDAVFVVGSDIDPVEYITSVNIRRRHLDESQRAMVAAKLANMRQGERTDISAIAGRSISQEAAGTMLDVSPDSIGRAKQVIDRGAPELVEAVEQGKVSVSAAADIAANVSKDEQSALAVLTEQEILDAAKGIRAAKVEQKRVARDAGLDDNAEWNSLVEKYGEAALREAVENAAKRALRGGGPRRPNKNPHYVPPTKAGAAWMNLYGTARALNEWATPENLALVVEGLNERSDDQSANIKAVVKLGRAVAAAMQAVAVPAAERGVAIPGPASHLDGVPCRSRATSRRCRRWSPPPPRSPRPATILIFRTPAPACRRERRHRA